MRGRLVIVLAVGVAMSVPLFAHHGSAAFDNTKTVTITGTVSQFVYSNPHLLVTVDVTGESGEVVQWVVETQSPNVMFPAGYRRDSFKPGDQVTVTVTPVKNGVPIGRIREVVLANGTTLGGIDSVPMPPAGR